jgi:hypothetical protein
MADLCARCNRPIRPHHKRVVMTAKVPDELDDTGTAWRSVPVHAECLEEGDFGPSILDSRHKGASMGCAPAGHVKDQVLGPDGKPVLIENFELTSFSLIPADQVVDPHCVMKTVEPKAERRHYFGTPKHTDVIDQYPDKPKPRKSDSAAPTTCPSCAGPLGELCNIVSSDGDYHRVRCRLGGIVVTGPYPFEEEAHNKFCWTCKKRIEDVPHWHEAGADFCSIECCGKSASKVEPMSKRAIVEAVHGRHVSLKTAAAKLGMTEDEVEIERLLMDVEKRGCILADDAIRKFRSLGTEGCLKALKTIRDRVKEMTYMQHYGASPEKLHEMMLAKRDGETDLERYNRMDAEMTMKLHDMTKSMGDAAWQSHAQQLRDFVKNQGFDIDAEDLEELLLYFAPQHLHWSFECLVGHWQKGVLRNSSDDIKKLIMSIAGSNGYLVAEVVSVMDTGVPSPRLRWLDPDTHQPREETVFVNPEHVENVWHEILVSAGFLPTGAKQWLEQYADQMRTFPGKKLVPTLKQLLEGRWVHFRLGTEECFVPPPFPEPLHKPDPIPGGPTKHTRVHISSDLPEEVRHKDSLSELAKECGLGVVNQVHDYITVEGPPSAVNKLIEKLMGFEQFWAHARHLPEFPVDAPINERWDSRALKAAMMRRNDPRAFEDEFAAAPPHDPHKLPVVKGKTADKVWIDELKEVDPNAPWNKNRPKYGPPIIGEAPGREETVLALKPFVGYTADILTEQVARIQHLSEAVTLGGRRWGKYELQRHSLAWARMRQQIERALETRIGEVADEAKIKENITQALRNLGVHEVKITVEHGTGYVRIEPQSVVDKLAPRDTFGVAAGETLKAGQFVGLNTDGQVVAYDSPQRDLRSDFIARALPTGRFPSEPTPPHVYAMSHEERMRWERRQYHAPMELESVRQDAEDPTLFHFGLRPKQLGGEDFKQLEARLYALIEEANKDPRSWMVYHHDVSFEFVHQANEVGLRYVRPDEIALPTDLKRAVTPRGEAVFLPPRAGEKAEMLYRPIRYARPDRRFLDAGETLTLADFWKAYDGPNACYNAAILLGADGSLDHPILKKCENFDYNEQRYYAALVTKFEEAYDELGLRDGALWEHLRDLKDDEGRLFFPVLTHVHVERYAKQWKRVWSRDGYLRVIAAAGETVPAGQEERFVRPLTKEGADMCAFDETGKSTIDDPYLAASQKNVELGRETMDRQRLPASTIEDPDIVPEKREVSIGYDDASGEEFE